MQSMHSCSLSCQPLCLQRNRPPLARLLGPLASVPLTVMRIEPQETLLERPRVRSCSRSPHQLHPQPVTLSPQPAIATIRTGRDEHASDMRPTEHNKTDTHQYRRAVLPTTSTAAGAPCRRRRHGLPQLVPPAQRPWVRGKGAVSVPMCVCAGFELASAADTHTYRHKHRYMHGHNHRWRHRWREGVGLAEKGATKI